MTTNQKYAALEGVLQELENQKQIDSLYYLVQKLPDFVSKLQVIDDKLDFIENVIEDKESLSAISNEIEEKIENLHIDETHFNALLELLYLLPKLVPLLKRTEEMLAFANDFLADKESVEYALEGMTDTVPLDKAAEIMKETNEHYKENKRETNYSLYSMYRLLKDPTIQKGFRYLESFLEVINKEK